MGSDFLVTMARWTETGLCCTLTCHTERDVHSARNTRDAGRAEGSGGSRGPGGNEASDRAQPECARHVSESSAMRLEQKCDQRDELSESFTPDHFVSFGGGGQMADGEGAEARSGPWGQGRRLWTDRAGANSLHPRIHPRLCVFFPVVNRPSANPMRGLGSLMAHARAARTCTVLSVRGLCKD